mgnify:CR=1 FL=1
MRLKFSVILNAVVLASCLGAFAGYVAAALPTDRQKVSSTNEVVSSLIVRFSTDKGPVPFSANARALMVAEASRSLGAGVSHRRVLATGADEDAARTALADSGARVKVAIVMLKAGVDAADAERRLHAADGSVDGALAV